MPFNIWKQAKDAVETEGIPVTVHHPTSAVQVNQALLNLKVVIKI